jgi:hypothetical protein
LTARTTFALLDDADTVNRPVRVFFGNRQPVAIAAQRNRRGQPADAAADNQDILVLHPARLAAIKLKFIFHSQ